MTDISALEAYAGQLSEAAQLSMAAAALQHQFVNADENTAIETESGPLPSLAKWRKDLGTLETQLADPDVGAEIVAWKRTGLYSAIKTANLALSRLVVNIWEFADLAIGYDPTGVVPYWQWDWTPATAAASYYVKNKGGGTVRYPSGAYLSAVHQAWAQRRLLTASITQRVSKESEVTRQQAQPWAGSA